LFLSGGCYPKYPNKHVTFEMYVVTASARRLKLMRIDWRSMRGGHTNMRRYNCPPECPGRTSDTHFHAFEINWSEERKKLRGPRLPCARDIEENLQSFEQLRDYVGKHFKINNIDAILAPEWEYRLPL
jgi:hypothetical protein